MKKVIKRIVITFASFILLVALFIGVAVWLVFTPTKITPIVRTQMAKYITCKSQIGEVELTFFSTFPRFGLKVNRFTLINHIHEVPSDTLVSTDQFVGIVDLAAWWKRKELVFKELQLHNGIINAFVDSLGHTNFDIIKADTVAAPSDSETPFRFINLENVELKNIHVSYVDQSMKFQTEVRDLSAQFSGKLISDTINTKINVSKGIVSLTYDGENYLRNASIKTNTNARFIVPKMKIDFGNSEATVNNMNLALSTVLLRMIQLTIRCFSI